MHLPVSPSLRPPPSVYLYSVIHHCSRMTSYAFPVPSHRRSWCNEAGQNRTMSSAAKWSEAPQPPQTNTDTADARVGFFFFYGLYWMPGGKARRHSSMLGLKPVGQGRSKKGKPGLIPTRWRKAWVEVWKHLGQSGGKKEINTDRSSQQLAAGLNHNREAKAGH